MYKCVVRFISSSTMKFKYFFWCSKIHISDYLQFLPVDQFFLLVLNETNEHDIIFFTWILSIYFYRKKPMLWHLVWILMSQDSCILIPMYIFCIKKITLFLFWYLKNLKKKNKTKVPDNINLNNIYTSPCFAESSHDVFH